MGAPAVTRPSSPARSPRRSPATRRAPRKGATRVPARSVTRPARKPSAASASPARRAAPRRDRRAAPARRRRSQTPAAGFAMIPVTAVGRTAGAVGDIADSGVVQALTRGRLWIALLGVLLGGIVALNVWGLSISASSSGTAAKIDALERNNSVLRARIARRLSTDRVQRAAASLGLEHPAPRAVRYIELRDRDAVRAARRLAGGAISVVASLPVVADLVESAESAAAPEAPEALEAADPVTAPPPDDPAPATAADPAAVTAPATAPDPAPAPAPPAGGGGMAAP